MKYKKGSIEITIMMIFIIIICILLTVVYLLYWQVNTVLSSMKVDIFYICQNSYFSLNKEELAYSNYEIDLELLNEKITKLLKLNYYNNNVKINNINYDYKNKEIKIDIDVEIIPLALEQIIGRVKINIKDNIKLKLMEVK